MTKLILTLVTNTIGCLAVPSNIRERKETGQSRGFVRWDYGCLYNDILSYFVLKRAWCTLLAYKLNLPVFLNTIIFHGDFFFFFSSAHQESGESARDSTSMLDLSLFALRARISCGC